MKKEVKIKVRNYQAVNAWFRSNAGAIPNKKKERNKKLCRKPIKNQ